MVWFIDEKDKLWIPAPLCSNSQKSSCGFWLFFELNFFTVSTDMLKKLNPKTNSKSLLHFCEFEQG